MPKLCTLGNSSNLSLNSGDISFISNSSNIISSTYNGSY